MAGDETEQIALIAIESSISLFAILVKKPVNGIQAR
jgi:hypothetical protein